MDATFEEELVSVCLCRAGVTAEWAWLCKRHEGMCRYYANSFLRVAPQNDIEDYMQEARLAIRAATITYQPLIDGVPIKFLTWLCWQLRKYIQRAACQGVIYVPRTDMANPNLSKEAKRRLRAARRVLQGFAATSEGEADESYTTWVSHEERGYAAIDGADEMRYVRQRIDKLLAAWITEEMENAQHRGKRRAAMRLARLQTHAAMRGAAILGRLRGQTLDEVAVTTGTSRERVRQICHWFIKAAPRLAAVA